MPSAITSWHWTCAPTAKAKDDTAPPATIELLPSLSRPGLSLPGSPASPVAGPHARTGLAEFVEIVGQAEETLESVVAAGDTLVSSGLLDATPRIRRHSLEDEGEWLTFRGLSSERVPQLVAEIVRQGGRVYAV